MPQKPLEYRERPENIKPAINHRKSYKDLRAGWVQIRMNAKEKRALTKKAHDAGFKTLSEYIRFLATDHTRYRPRDHLYIPHMCVLCATIGDRSYIVEKMRQNEIVEVK